MARLANETGQRMLCPKRGTEERVLSVNTMRAVNGMSARLHVRTNHHDHFLTKEAYEAAKSAYVEANEGVYGHCDTCGAVCDASGCTVDNTHEVALP